MFINYSQNLTDLTFLLLKQFIIIIIIPIFIDQGFIIYPLDHFIIMYLEKT